MTSSTVAEALRSGPRRLLASLWPVRALAYVASGVVVGAVALVWLPVALILGAVVGTPALTLPLVALERRRLVLLGGPQLPDPHRRPDRPGLAAWLRARYAEPVTWRELAYLVLLGTVLLVMDATATALALSPILILGAGALTTTDQGAAAPFDVAVAVVVAALALLALAVLATAVLYLVPLVAIGRGAIARQLLAAGAEATRTRLVDAFEVERRRIERDLHDGAQQRLLELGLTIVAARLELDDDPAAARARLDLAAGQATSALAELRELIRGIHPRVLTDLGLAAAVHELADRSVVPVHVELNLTDRLASTVESTAYFVIAEAMANAVKHANATVITVRGRRDGSRLVVEVRDDGVGGADPARGTGLSGLADRVDARGGTLRLSSPPGGPTVLTVELPCLG